LHVLVVDDEPLNRELLRRVLQREYEISEAEDAIQALEMIESTQGGYRVVLCDQLMPGKSGSELAEEVSARWPNTLFLLITGYDDDPQVQAARDRGVVHHVVTKPWTARGLKAVILRYVGPA
jgi:two-component system response regulator HupR/HoxA